MAPPPHFFMNHPPFQSYPPFLANFLVPPPPKWLNFWKVLPLPLPSPLDKKGGRGRSNDEYWYCIGITLQKTTEYKLKILISFFFCFTFCFYMFWDLDCEYYVLAKQILCLLYHCWLTQYRDGTSTCTPKTQVPQKTTKQLIMQCLVTINLKYKTFAN